jgi:two-component system LytT family sensor kinase
MPLHISVTSIKFYYIAIPKPVIKMGTAENIFLLSLNMLAGSLVVLLFLIGYVWYFTKDKTIGVYGVCLVTCFCVTVVKMINTANGALYINVMENNLLDELTKSLVGLAYIFFFGVVFEFNIRGKWQVFFWKTAMAFMTLQIIYLLYTALKGSTNYFHPVITPLLVSVISLVALVLVVFAFLIKDKSRFQKIILAGVLVFYVLVLVGNLSEYFFKTGKSGFNMLFFALLVENIFFSIASAERIRDIYQKAAHLKLSSYQHQLEIEKVTGFFSATIHQHDDTGKLLWDVAKNLIGKLGFEDCMIYLWNDEKTVLLQKAGYGIKGSMQTEIDKNIYHVPKGKGIVGAAVESGLPMLVNDTTLDKRYYSADCKIMLSELCVPLIQNHQVIGAINTENSGKNFYTERHLQLLTTIASMLAHKIDTIEALQQNREKEIEVLELNKNLATSQLTALRTQMNPHFIFNALNSIQQYILQGNVTEANKYLSKFSRLQREILNNSNQHFILLEKEIEILDSYLLLEQLRFGKNFTYHIAMTDEIDPAEIKIPPMMMQPFVENAIWHGLMPKPGERKLDIHFDLHTDDILLAIIRDNGIGREASAKLKQNNRAGQNRHESKGMSMVEHRLQLLQQQYDKPFDAAVADITDADGMVLGTQVTLKIFIGNK